MSRNNLADIVRLARMLGITLPCTPVQEPLSEGNAHLEEVRREEWRESGYFVGRDITLDAKTPYTVHIDMIGKEEDVGIGWID